MSEKEKSVSYLYVYSENSGNTEELMKKSVKDFLIKNGDSLGSEEINICKTAKGKPYIVGTENVYLSVTHSGDFCIVAVSCCEIGVDLQYHERLRLETKELACERYLKLSKRFFHKEEYEYVKTDPLIRFFDVWTAKESYVKFTGEGIDDSFWSYSVLPEDADNGLSSWVKRNTYFSIVPFRLKYTLCFCSKKSTAISIFFK